MKTQIENIDIHQAYEILKGLQIAVNDIEDLETDWPIVRVAIDFALAQLKANFRDELADWEMLETAWIYIGKCEGLQSDYRRWITCALERCDEIFELINEMEAEPNV